MSNKHKIALGSALLVGSLTVGFTANAQGFFESEIILNSFQEPVTITPAGQASPITPSQGMALSPGSEVVTEEGAAANVAFNCKVNVPAGSGLVVGASGAAECIDGTANIQGADQVVANPNPGQCEEPVATLSGGPGVFVNGTPASGPIDLCPGDSVVGQVQIVYGCTVAMGENSRLQINDYSDCAEGRTAVAAAGSGAVGSGAGASAAGGAGAAGGGLGAVAGVGAAAGIGIAIGIANDDDDGEDDGGQPSPN
jgi:hypothetical protein